MSETNMLALVKGEERFVFFYDDASRIETLKCFCRYATREELDFAVLGQRLKNEATGKASN